MDEIQKRILAEVADLHTVPEGAYNIRANGKTAARNTTANIDITPKPDGSGIDTGTGVVVEFQFFRRDLVDKPGETVAVGGTKNHSLGSMGEVQPPLGPGNTHIAETALFLQLHRIINAAHRGEDAVFQTGQENHREFQSLGGVHRHHQDAVLFLIHVVQIGIQGNFLQETIQCPLWVLLFIFDHGGLQLAQVLHPGFALIAHGFEHGIVAGFLHDLIQQDVQSGFQGCFSKVLDHGGEFHQGQRFF